MSDQQPRGGARRAQRRPAPSIPRLPVNLSIGGLVLVVIAAALVLVTPSGPGAASRPTAATGAAVAETVLGCPRRLTSPPGSTTSFSVASAPLESAVEGGSVNAEPGGSISVGRGDAAAVDGTSQQGLIVRGEGGLAQGLFAWRTDTGAGPAASTAASTAVAECSSPRASWWFTGAGAAIDHESRLVLSNVDAGPSVVDVRVLSPEGDVDVSESGGRGVQVPAGGQVALPLANLTPQNDELSIWVHATRGRVVAAISDRYAASPTAASGYEWIPAQTDPSRTVRLSGIPATAQSKTLLVGNPSDLEALVSVELSGPNGRFVPAGLADLSVPPGSVATLDLTDALPGEPFAVRVRSKRAVVASVRTVLPNGEVTYAGVASPITAATAGPVVGRSTVQLTAGGETARASLTSYDDGGDTTGTTQLSMAANATGIWEVPADSAYVVVTPTQGEPFGSVVFDRSAALPLRALPDMVRVPVVRPAA